ncbi:GlxA family transcriptional regulator [Allokutzneria albata]|uniref:Transcriptional regulator GlxA family, contains an amidase domain and an AraC-type DNA-binding HTH domain n=1 Tax=Allokutzneria albata TaxID=211114 RepID=A0A1G9RI99_ALLAB|nr:helix-turn-helix domain-containing protein [Allokutzneria albata]SDM23052.1 Transcriptional regulator GlxA family, contains an amidase domain and an AraC-type DNA-binding HTH domain [Allokutzneria albata]
MHEVVVLALPGTVAFDLATPWQIFEYCLDDYEPPPGVPFRPYRVRQASLDGQPVATASGLRIEVHGGPELIAQADTVISPGLHDEQIELPEWLLAEVRKAHDSGTRMASICSGAFVLARAGVLDGREATTHWLLAEVLGEQFTGVKVDPDVLYVESGSVFTASGGCGGTDLCLRLISLDLGIAAANHAARNMVLPGHRGGQRSQVIEQPVPADADYCLDELREWMLRHVHEKLSVRELAARVHMSERTFTRRFRAETGMSPQQWILRQRIATAQRLLELTEIPVEGIARAVGFSCAAALRTHFQSTVDTTPTKYRARMRA